MSIRVALHHKTVYNYDRPGDAIATSGAAASRASQSHERFLLIR